MAWYDSIDQGLSYVPGYSYSKSVYNKVRNPDQPSKTGGEYEGLPGQEAAAFNVPGFAQQQAGLNRFALERGGGPFRSQQTTLANALQRQMKGQDSLSRTQLRQDVGRLQAQQQSMAAGAAPGQSALASRLAMQGAGQIGAGMAGNAALAGIAERQAASQALGNVLQGARGQDISSYLGAQELVARQAQAQQGAQLAREQLRSERYKAALGVPSNFEVTTGLLKDAGSALATMGSDVRLKRDIKPVNNPGLEFKGGDYAPFPPNVNPRDVQADSPELVESMRNELWKKYIQKQPSKDRPALEKFLSAAQPYEFQYKPGKGLPPGRRTGVMAQNVEQVAPDAVQNTPQGKYIDYSKLGPALMASQGYLNQKLEGLKSALRATPQARPQAMLRGPGSEMPRDIRGIADQLRSIQGGDQAVQDYAEQKRLQRLRRIPIVL